MSFVVDGRFTDLNFDIRREARSGHLDQDYYLLRPTCFTYVHAIAINLASSQPLIERLHYLKSIARERRA